MCEAVCFCHKSTLKWTCVFAADTLLDGCLNVNFPPYAVKGSVLPWTKLVAGDIGCFSLGYTPLAISNSAVSSDSCSPNCQCASTIRPPATSADTSVVLKPDTPGTQVLEKISNHLDKWLIIWVIFFKAKMPKVYWCQLLRWEYRISYIFLFFYPLIYLL